MAQSLDPTDVTQKKVDSSFFSKKFEAILKAARDDACSRKYEHVGTENILLAILGDANIVTATLKRLGIPAEKITESLLALIPQNSDFPPTEDLLPYTSRSKRVLELAMRHSREMEQAPLGVDHLFMGLIREERGIAAQVLSDLIPNNVLEGIHLDLNLTRALGFQG